MLRCVIVDDNQSFLDAATKLLERQGVTVSGVASTAADAIATVRREEPDVVLVDITLGPDSGFDVAREVNEFNADVKVILISTHSGSDFAELIEQSPAVGFVPKSRLSGSVVRQLVNAGQGR